jgi:hypothetical protein
MALVKTALPKGRSGRKPTPMDDALVTELLNALKSNPTETVDGEVRPAAYGPDTDFDTLGKATSAGRRYANAVAEKLGKPVKVNGFAPNGNQEKGPFRWRAYVSLKNSQGSTPAKKEDEAKK